MILLNFIGILKVSSCRFFIAGILDRHFCGWYIQSGRFTIVLYRCPYFPVGISSKDVWQWCFYFSYFWISIEFSPCSYCWIFFTLIFYECITTKEPNAILNVSLFQFSNYIIKALSMGRPFLFLLSHLYAFTHNPTCHKLFPVFQMTFLSFLLCWSHL